MKQYFGMTLPHQTIPDRKWKMFIVYKDDKTGAMTYKKKITDTLQQMNEIRAKVLEQHTR